MRMGKTGIIVTGLVAIALVIGIIVVVNNKNDKSADNQATSAQTQKTDTTIESPAPQSSNLITYSNSGFSPSTLTVKSGDSVTIKNNSNSSIQIQSNPHPIHTDNDELNVGAIQAGKTATFTVTKKGTFGYHNHLNSSETGTIIVE